MLHSTLQNLFKAGDFTAWEALQFQTTLRRLLRTNAGRQWHWLGVRRVKSKSNRSGRRPRDLPRQEITTEQEGTAGVRSDLASHT